MKKELVIFIVIVIIILIGNYITENYTNHCVSQTSEYLYELKEDIEQEEIDNEIVKEKVENIYNDWIEKHKKLAYYTDMMN